MGVTQGPWYVGTQNDILYVINRPPRPSHDDMANIRDVQVIATLNACKSDDDARVLAAAWEMREALKALCEASIQQVATYDHEVWKVARAAYAKSNPQ